MKNATEAAGRLSLSLKGLATDLDTERGGTDANKRDGARQVGRLNVAGLQSMRPRVPGETATG